MRGDGIAFGLLQRLWPQTVNITRGLCRWIKCQRSSLRYAVLAISHSMDMQPHLADGRHMGVYGVEATVAYAPADLRNSVDKPLRIQCSHTACARAGACLAIDVIHHIAAGKYAGDAGFRCLTF